MSSTRLNSAGLWLMPSLLGTKSMAVGTCGARTALSCSAPLTVTGNVITGNAAEPFDEPGVHRPRGDRFGLLELEPQPALFAQVLHDLRGSSPSPAVNVVVRGARKSIVNSTRSAITLTAFGCIHEPPDGDHALRRRQLPCTAPRSPLTIAAAPASASWRSSIDVAPGVVRFAVYRHAILPPAGDRGDDRQPLVAPPHAGALLDVHFDQAEISAGASSGRRRRSGIPTPCGRPASQVALPGGVAELRQSIQAEVHPPTPGCRACRVRTSALLPRQTRSARAATRRCRPRAPTGAIPARRRRPRRRRNRRRAGRCRCASRQSHAGASQPSDAGRA